jgi:hypothetical protein
VFIRTSDNKYINLDHVVTAVVVESRGTRAVKLIDSGGRELGVVRESDLDAVTLKPEINR